MPPTDPRLEVLAELRKQTALLGAILLALNERRTITPAHGAAVVNESVITGPHGDPVIKAKSPRDWAGDDMTGRKFSECPPDYLDLLAERYDYFASKEEDATKKRYNDLDAKRARAWASKLRGGYVPPVAAPRVSETQGEPTW